MIAPNQTWRRREPLGGDDLWDEIRILGSFEGELTLTSNIGFSEVISAIAESVIEHYVQVGPEGTAEVAEPATAAVAPWQTPERELAARG